jgi:hypothetical protein
MVAWFAAGIAASLAVVNVRIVVLDLVRPTGLNVLVKQLAQTPRDRPILMLIGSSFTFLGLDTAQLEAELAAKGRSYRVVKFAAGGVSSLERLRYLREVERRAGGFRPAVILMEVSAYYDKEPLLQFEHNLFSQRMVDMVDLETAARALSWVWATSSLRTSERIRMSAQLLQHLGAHYSKLGIKFDFMKYRKLIVSAPENAAVVPDPKFSNEELGRSLDRAELILTKGEWAEVEDWGNRQYDAMIALLGRGEAKIGFYALPNTLGTELAYAWSFCQQSARSSACIIPDRDLLNALRDRSMWMDISHLFGEGVKSTTSWFADQIARRIP